MKRDLWLVMFILFLGSHLYGMTDAEGKTEVVSGSEVTLPSEDIYKDNIKLRYFMRGDEKHYCALFKKAVEQENVVLQVALANAYFAAEHDNDAAKDFSTYDPKKFRKFGYARREDYSQGFSPYYLHERLYLKTFGTRVKVEEVDEVYNQAALAGFIPAVIFQIVHPRFIDKVDIMQNLKILEKYTTQERTQRLAGDDSGDLGYGEAMLEYGMYLVNQAKHIGNVALARRTMRTGIRCIHDSGLVNLLYPEKGEKLEVFWKKNHSYMQTFSYEGIYFLMSIYTVLVPEPGHFDRVTLALPSRL